MNQAVLYRELEPHFNALIRSNARRFAKVLDLSEEDVAQEARIALYLALPRYEYNKSYGKIHSFARRAIRNALCSLAASATMESRVQRVVISDGGELKTIRCRPTQLEDFDLVVDEDQDLDRNVDNSRWAQKIVKLESKLIELLDDRQKRVFQCLARPANELQLMARNKGCDITNLLISQYLGLSKNSVDWAIHMIKRHFTLLAEAEFSEIVDRAIEDRNWPMIHWSARENDLRLVRSVIKKRQLDPRPTRPMDTVRRGRGMARRVETYGWGSVILLRYNGKPATVVVEGRFNELTGEVLVESGYWKSISDAVPFYKKLVRELQSPVRGVE